MTDQDANRTANQELAQQLYDMLMRDIEPDLLSYNIVKLAEYYKDETETENTERLQRYQKAYQEFDRVFQSFMNEVQDEVRTTKRDSLEKTEQSDRAGETDNIEALEETLDALPES